MSTGILTTRCLEFLTVRTHSCRLPIAFEQHAVTDPIACARTANPIESAHVCILLCYRYFLYCRVLQAKPTATFPVGGHRERTRVHTTALPLFFSVLSSATGQTHRGLSG